MDASNQALLRSFTRSLRTQNRSANTIKAYDEAARLLAEFRPGVPFEAMERDDIAEFIHDQLARHKSTTASVRYRALRRFFGWLADEEIIAASPMAKMSGPSVPEPITPVLTDSELSRLLKVTNGKVFEQRRDHAIIRVLVDTGVRAGELIGMQVDDVDLDVHDVIHVVGKGSRARAVPFGAKTGTALDRYLRERAKHRQHKLPNLWIGERGPLTDSGLRQVLERRGQQADVYVREPDGKGGYEKRNLHAHVFRHTFSHIWRASGGDDDSLMRIAGWKSRQMLHRYGASGADARAVEAHRKLSPGDRL